MDPHEQKPEQKPAIQIPSPEEVNKFGPLPPGVASVKMQDEFLKHQCLHILVSARTMEHNYYLMGLAEIRNALAYGKAKVNDTAFGERTPVEPLFDEIDIGRLRERYMELLKRFMEYNDHMHKLAKVSPENKEAGT